MMDLYVFFFFNDTATTEIYTLSLHDALPISLITRDIWALADNSGWPQLTVIAVGSVVAVVVTLVVGAGLWERGRESTRLNSSHANISYAVFCLKKKKN